MNDKPMQTASGHTPDNPNAFLIFKGVTQAIIKDPASFAIGAVGKVNPALGYAGHAFRSVVRGEFHKRIVADVEQLIHENAIKQEYLESEQAHACFADLLDYIDKISPDPKRYEAIRTAFLKILGRGETGKQAPYAQQMLRVIYGLSAGEITVLGTIYNMGGGGRVNGDTWLNEVANKSGLLRSELVAEIEDSLLKKRLILKRNDSRVVSEFNQGDVLKWGMRNRLTTLGQEVCETFARPQS